LIHSTNVLILDGLQSEWRGIMNTRADVVFDLINTWLTGPDWRVARPSSMTSRSFSHRPLNSRSISSTLTISQSCRGGHRHLQIGRMLDIDLILESPPRCMYTKCGNLCGQKGQGIGQRSKVVILPTSVVRRGDFGGGSSP
jgi:hypothetical protein